MKVDPHVGEGSLERELVDEAGFAQPAENEGRGTHMKVVVKSGAQNDCARLVDGDPEVDVLHLLQNAVGVTINDRVHEPKSLLAPATLERPPAL